MSGILWLASFPKSGNTWLRVFLANLMRGGAEPVDINRIELATIASDRTTADDILGFDTADLTDDEVDCLRPEVYRQVAHASAAPVFMKIHDAYTMTARGEPMIPPEVTRAAIYVVRNPLDVTASLIGQGAESADEVVGFMGRSDSTSRRAGDAFPVQLRQRLSSWSQHAASWIDQRDVPVHVVRYEDMVWRPAETFRAVARCAGLSDAPADIDRALAHSSFETLKAQERARGFKERCSGSDGFFHSGRVGSWRQRLEARQVERLVVDHHAVMARLGYLSAAGLLQDCCPQTRL